MYEISHAAECLLSHQMVYCLLNKYENNEINKKTRNSASKLREMEETEIGYK